MVHVAKWRTKELLARPPVWIRQFRISRRVCSCRRLAGLNVRAGRSLELFVLLGQPHIVGWRGEGSTRPLQEAEAGLQEVLVIGESVRYGHRAEVYVAGRKDLSRGVCREVEPADVRNFGEDLREQAI